MHKLFAFLFLTFISTFAHSNIYYVVQSYSPTHQFQTIQSACDAHTKNIWPSRTSTFVVTSTTTFTCRTHDSIAGPVKSSFSGQIFGQSCTPPKVYDSSVGGCLDPEPDLCESTIGNFIYHEFAFATIGADSNPSQDPPITVCKDSCQYSHTFDGFTTPPKRDFTPPDKILGSFKYKGNGTSCTPSANDPSVFDQPPSKAPVTTPPEYNQENKCDDWVTNPDGTSSRSCTSKKEFKEPGKLDCVGLTAAHCKPGKPSPEYTKTETSETTTQTTNPDGSKKTDTTTTTDKTTCKGLKPCTSTSKDEKETSSTNPDGTPGDQEKECTGTGCKDEEEGADGEDEEEDEPVSSVSGGATCDAPPTCEGDAIQCAILKQQFESRCDFEAAGDFEGSKSDIEALVQGERFELDTSEIDAPSFINSGSRFLPASCPPPESITLSSNGGHTFYLKYDPLCSFASDFSYLIMAMMGIWCAVYVGRAFGGE